MAINKADAIILQSRKQGETSKLLTLFTREFGKMSVVAKGSRGTRSKYLGALETFNHVSIVFYKKEGRQLQYLSDASINEPFPDLHSRLGKMALAAVACEVVAKSEQDDQSHPEQFQLLLDTLRALEKNDNALRNIVRAFQIQYISQAGYEPLLDNCYYCQKSEVEDINFFSFEQGVYSCNHCGQVEDSSKKVSGYILELLRWFKNVSIKNAVQVRMSKGIGEEIDAILMEYLQTHIDTLFRLNSIDHLKKLEIELGRT